MHVIWAEAASTFLSQPYASFQILEKELCGSVSFVKDRISRQAFFENNEKGGGSWGLQSS